MKIKPSQRNFKLFLTLFFFLCTNISFEADFINQEIHPGILRKLHNICNPSLDLAYATKADKTEWIGAWPHGPINTIAMKDNLLYAGAGGAIEIWDIHNFKNPSKINRVITQGIVMDLRIYKNFLYASSGSAGIYIYNLSEPETPKLSAIIDSDDWTSSIFLEDIYLYQCDSQAGVNIFDITKPSEPKKIKSLTFNQSVNDVILDRDSMYVATDKGLIILKKLNDFRFRYISKSFHGEIKDLAILNRRLYLSVSSEGFYIVDMENVNKPVILFRDKDADTAENIHIRNDRLYLSAGEEGLFIYNAANPVKPEIIHHLALGDVEQSLTKQNVLYVASDENGIFSFDVSDPHNPIKVKQFGECGEITNLLMHYPYAYITSTLGQLFILDISKLEKIKLVANCLFYDPITKIERTSLNTALITTVQSPTDIYNISKIESPTLVSLSDVGDLDHLAYNDKYVFMLCDSTDFHILSNPQASLPEHISTTQIFGAKKMAVHNNSAYILTRQNELFYLDVSNPDRTQTPQSLNYKNVIDIATHKGYLHVITADNTYKILDLRQPYNPHEIRSMADLQITNFAFNNDLVFLSTNEKEIHVYKIIKPRKMIKISEYKLTKKADSISILKNYALITTAGKGISVIDISHPASLKQISFFENASIKNISLHSNYAFMIKANSGFSVLDLTNPSKIETIQTIDTEYPVVNISLYNQYAYVRSMKKELYKIDLTKPCQLNKKLHYDGYPIQATDHPEKPIFHINGKIFFGIGRKLYATDAANTELNIGQSDHIYTLPDEIKQIYAQLINDHVNFYIANEDAGLQILRKPLKP